MDQHTAAAVAVVAPRTLKAAGCGMWGRLSMRRWTRAGLMREVGRIDDIGLEVGTGCSFGRGWVLRIPV